MAQLNSTHRDITYTLELSPNELATLYVILMHVGGNPDNTPRKHADAMLKAIDEYVPGAYDAYDNHFLDGDEDLHFEGCIQFNREFNPAFVKVFS